MVIGHTLIETSLSSISRRREKFAIRRTLHDRLTASHTPIVAMPEPRHRTISDRDGPTPFLEGGDVLLLGPDLYVGNSGNSSNPAGIQWLQTFLGESYRVHEVKLHPQFGHLDCCLCTPRPGLAIVCREAFAAGLPAFLHDWQVIEVSAEAAQKQLACNHLILDEQTLLIPSDLPHLAEQLQQAGQTVIPMPFDHVRALGGSFRCWHHPLWRESQPSESASSPPC